MVRMYRIYPVVALLGLALMFAGVATTYVALGQDGDQQSAEESTATMLPTPTLEPTVEPPAAEAAPALVNPPAAPPQPPADSAAPSVPPAEQAAVDVVEIPAPPEQTEVVVAAPVENLVPTATVVVIEQAEVVAPPADQPSVPESASPQPEQTEAVAPTAVDNAVPPEPTSVPEQPEMVMPTEPLPTQGFESNPTPSDPGALPDLGTGQSINLEVPTAGPDNPLETPLDGTPAVVPTLGSPDAAESTAEPGSATPVDPLASATPGDLVTPENRAEATEEVSAVGTTVLGSVSSAFGQQGIALKLTLPDGSIVEGTSDEQGGFTFENLVPGDYLLEASAPGSLSRLAAFTLVEGQPLELPPAVLAAGDLNQDNQVDLSDVVLVAANYNNPVEATGADLNGDAWIDISDLAIIGAQFGAIGPLPWM